MLTLKSMTLICNSQLKIAKLKSQVEKLEAQLKSLLKKEFRCEIVVDDGLLAFGAHWIPEDPEEDENLIALNLGACLLCSVSESDVDFKELVVETLMHEFGHVVEKWVGLEANEERIEALVAAYRQKYGSPANKALHADHARAKQFSA
jgi:hypothetical protein